MASLPLGPPQHLPRGRKTLDQELPTVAGLHPILSSKFRMKGQNLRTCMSNVTTVSIFSLLQVLVCWTLGHQPFPAASFQMPYVRHPKSFQYLLWHPCSRFSLLVWAPQPQFSDNSGISVLHIIAWLVLDMIYMYHLQTGMGSWHAGECCPESKESR